MQYCFLDLETTGLDPQRDSILEISWVLEDETGQQIETFDEVFHPDKSPLTPFVTHLTGITESEISRKGKRLATLRTVLSEKLKNSVIVGHNIDFDLQFLQENGVEVSQNQRIDTHELARILLVGEESFSLEVLSKKYDFEHKDAHRALSDARASRELFRFLQQKIEALSPDFLKTIQVILEEKTDWIAKELFLHAAATGEFAPKREPASYRTAPPESVSDADQKKVLEPKTAFIRAGDSHATANLQKSLAFRAAEEGPGALIVTPKLDFFADLPWFPVPEVLLDPVRLEQFASSRETLSNAECTFFLQAKFRHFLGYRGKDFFDLFAGQRNFWPEVCASEKSNVFATVLQEKKSEKILVLSPRAFLRFRNLDWFAGRKILVDEAELFAEDLLFFPSTQWSLATRLRSSDEDISAATQFFIRNFCREVIEKKLNRTLSTFPERILLDSSQDMSSFSEAISAWGDSTFATLTEALSTPRERLVRWTTYSPQSGNLSFGAWHPDDWRDLKKELGQFSVVYFYRHVLGEANLFFRIFVGTFEGVRFFFPGLFPQGPPRKKLEIPGHLVSAKSPEFNRFSLHKIQEIVSQKIAPDHAVAVNFSSLETLKNVFLEFSHFLSDQLKDADVSAFGEKVSGGDGKLLQLAQQPKKLVLFFQKMMTAELEQFPFRTLIFQKFPFDPPHPLFEAVEKALEESRLKLWDLWTIPRVSANISRRDSLFPHREKILFLDSRENASWGREILHSAFPDFSVES